MTKMLTFILYDKKLPCQFKRSWISNKNYKINFTKNLNFKVTNLWQKVGTLIKNSQFCKFHVFTTKRAVTLHLFILMALTGVSIFKLLHFLCFFDYIYCIWLKPSDNESSAKTTCLHMCIYQILQQIVAIVGCCISKVYLEVFNQREYGFIFKVRRLEMKMILICVTLSWRKCVWRDRGRTEQ